MRILRVPSDRVTAFTPDFLEHLGCSASHGGSLAPRWQRLLFRV